MAGEQFITCFPAMGFNPSCDCFLTRMRKGSCTKISFVVQMILFHKHPSLFSMPQTIALPLCCGLCLIQSIEFLPVIQKITAALYCDQLQYVHDALLKKQPVSVKKKKKLLEKQPGRCSVGMLFLQNNMKPHPLKKSKMKLWSLRWDSLDLQLSD